MSKRFMLILIMILSSIVPVSAEGVDDQGNPNDPEVNDRANACYEGGTMLNQCNTKLDWQAGWYLIRFEMGILSRDEIPDWVGWVLPPEVLPDELRNSVMIPVPSGACLSDGPNYYNFAGGYFLPYGSASHSDTNCAVVQAGFLAANIVYAPPPFDAFTLCQLNGNYSGVSGSIGDNLHVCQP